VENITKPLPANLEAERVLLGAALLNPKAAVEIQTLIREQEFFDLRHRLIFRRIQSLAARGVPPDLVTVLEDLNSSGELQNVEAGYLSSLIDGVPSVNNVSHYARIVRERSKRRDLISFGEKIQDLAWNKDQGPGDSILSADDIAGFAVDSALNIAAGSDAPVVARSWSDVAASAFREIESANRDPQSIRYFKFGLGDLDEMTGGLRPKELVLIVAPTSNGKSQLALQLAMQCDLDGHKALYFSAEMPAEQFALRQLAFDAFVKFYFVRRPDRLHASELERLRIVSERQRDIRFVDRDITPTRVWAMSEAVKRAQGLDIVVIDYDQLIIEAGIDPKGDEDNVFRHQRAFVLAAKRLAERLDVCVVLLSQLRKVPPKIQSGAQPHLDDIWGDSSVRNTPHVILWVAREFFSKGMDIAYERKANVYVIKSRNDRTGVVPLEFDPERVRFVDAPPTEANSTEERTQYPLRNSQ
jgi:replicative DNA helicase